MSRRAARLTAIRLVELALPFTFLNSGVPVELEGSGGISSTKESFKHYKSTRWVFRP